jgi:uncharacterized membrane protein
VSGEATVAANILRAVPSAAAVVLKEKLNMRLAIGSLLISAGIVLVSLS